MPFVRVVQVPATTSIVSGSPLPSAPGSEIGSASNSAGTVSNLAGSVAAIVGSIVADLVVIVTVAGLIFYKRRNHRLRNGGLSEEEQWSHAGDGHEDYEVKGTPPSSPPSSPRLGNSQLSSSLHNARSPQMMLLRMGDLESQAVTLAGDEELKGDSTSSRSNSNGHKNPQDHEQKDQLDRMLQLHREQLQQNQELLRSLQLENPRALSPHT
ncbi:hypothetical protein BGX24_001080 [Mortierella sp. AD032]|nr:hypothetical protein BGX24_001080 [Mortierella sp. AD032]